MGEGELARVLAAVEALTSQVGDISTAVQQQQQGLEEVRRERAREAEEAAARASEEGREEPSERSGAGGDVHGREACPTFVHPCTSTRESLFFALGFGVMCV